MVFVIGLQHFFAGKLFVAAPRKNKLKIKYFTCHWRIIWCHSIVIFFSVSLPLSLFLSIVLALMFLCRFDFWYTIVTFYCCTLRRFSILHAHIVPNSMHFLGSFRCAFFLLVYKYYLHKINGHTRVTWVFEYVHKIHIKCNCHIYIGNIIAALLSRNELAEKKIILIYNNVSLVNVECVAYISNESFCRFSSLA